MSSTLIATTPDKINLSEWAEVAHLIDHSRIQPGVTPPQIISLCEEALHFGFASVFVNPTHVAMVASLLRSSAVKVGSTVGFPLGANLTSTKRAEAADLVLLGAQELDMVINLAALKAKDRVLVENDIRAVAEVAHGAGATLKVILETCLLTVDEKILACELAVVAGADFVKTSTGLNGAGATVDDVALMRGVVGSRAGVKASGGIRTAEGLATMVKAGANRIGTSSGLQIMQELGASF
ncbi:MAG TPA: deoxyribose-phosphate aldolase [Terriglobales bacterium]|jgi:deoxyribose-phosphate aldolase|nr:deoxyribose-phosphate aldolase [Terriglobales bacterium]